MTQSIITCDLQKCTAHRVALDFVPWMVSISQVFVYEALEITSTQELANYTRIHTVNKNVFFEVKTFCLHCKVVLLVGVLPVFPHLFLIQKETPFPLFQVFPNKKQDFWFQSSIINQPWKMNGWNPTKNHPFYTGKSSSKPGGGRNLN